MKVNVTRQELRECVENAFKKAVNEKQWDDDNFENDDYGYRNSKKQFNKKGPKHAKMGPMKKDKYRNNYGDY